MVLCLPIFLVAGIVIGAAFGGLAGWILEWLLPGIGIPIKNALASFGYTGPLFGFFALVGAIVGAFASVFKKK